MKFNTRSVPNCRTAIELQCFTRTEIPMRSLPESCSRRLWRGRSGARHPRRAGTRARPRGPDASALANQANAIFKPLPEWMGDKPSDEMVALGRQLLLREAALEEPRHLVQLLPLDNFGQDDGLPRTQGPARRPEFTDLAQRSAPHRAVLGRPRRGCRSPGKGSDPQPDRDGHRESDRGRGHRVDPGTPMFEAASATPG